MTRFIEYFWGSDFTSTAGFDSLVRRLRDGKQTCQDFEDFMKQRADIEEKYGKQLMRLAKSNEAKDEIGSLKDSWDCLRNETENIGRTHVAFAQQLLDILDKAMRDFRETQRNKRKQIEESVKKAQRNKRNHYENNLKLKRFYEQKCREQDAADDSLKRCVSTASKDEEKQRAKLGKAKTAVEQADTAYQNSVRSLEESREIWEKEMASCCNSFQRLEEERIAYLRNEMWIYTNLGSTLCVKADEIYEEMRKSLENCDVDSDIKLFISIKHTGCEKPAPIEYENYYMVQSSQRTTPLTTGAVSNANREAPSAARNRRPPTALPSPPGDPDNLYDPDLYSTVDEMRKAPKLTHSTSRAKEKICMALFDYEAQGDQELSFKAGDNIRLLFTEGDLWCCGTLKDRKGMFPKTFVKMP